MERIGRYTIKLSGKTGIVASAAVGGKTEGEGPLAADFDRIYPDDGIGKSTWEEAESELCRSAVSLSVNKAGKKLNDIDMIFAGDLLDQCTGSTFGIKDMDIPFHGVYGACSTMALSLASASLFADSGCAGLCVAATSSHFCSAEKQFRFPLEYGGQRTPTAQRTATAAGAAVISRNNTAVKTDKVIYGKIVDPGITDANNMGAAMAPAAADTIYNFLADTNTKPTDYDMILTGDLGRIGSDLLYEYMTYEYDTDISGVHNDCGLMLFNRNTQDVHSGGSGCGCSAAVLCGHIIPKMMRNELNNVLFVATGALLSSTSALQKKSIPGIAHGVQLISDHTQNRDQDNIPGPF